MKSNISSSVNEINDFKTKLNRANHDLKQDQSDNSDDGETDEGDYTVYECPGLAPVFNK